MPNWNELTDQQLKEYVLQLGISPQELPTSRRGLLLTLREHVNTRTINYGEVAREAGKQNFGNSLKFEVGTLLDYDSYGVTKNAGGFLVVLSFSLAQELYQQKMWEYNHYENRLSSVRLIKTHGTREDVLTLVDYNGDPLLDYKGRVLTNLQTNSRREILYNGRPVLMLDQQGFHDIIGNPLYLTPGGTFRDSHQKKYRSLSPNDIVENIADYE